VSGIVTLEDLLEEVFGEIREEHEGSAEIQELPDGSLLVEGQVHIEDLEARLSTQWEREGYDTVAGLVMSLLGRIPRRQECVETPGARFTVIAMDGPRVLQVRVEPVT